MGKASKKKRAAKEINENTGRTQFSQRFAVKQSSRTVRAQGIPSERYYLALLVALITFALYLPSLGNEFLASWDDGDYVLNNVHIRSLNLSLLKWAFFDFYASNWHPLTWISHALDYAVWGLKPWGHHLTNIILHGVNTFILIFLVFRLVERAKGSTESSEPSLFLNQRAITITGVVTGLLFGLHPLHVESVAWISERKDLLCALFYLLSVVMYLKYEEGNLEKLVEKPALMLFNWRHLPALGFFILALLSKPMAVTLPFVLLILDWYPLKRIHSLRTFSVAFIDKLPFIALSVISSILTILAQRTQMAFQLMEFVPFPTRVIVAAKSLMTYLWKVVFPFHLVPFYPYPETLSPTPTDYILAYIPLVAITIASVAFARKRKLWLSVWGYYVITLLPVIGILQVGRQAMADRYMYLPSVGPFLILGLLSAWIWARVSVLDSWKQVAKYLSTSIAVIALCFISYLTFEQIGIWKNNIDLWSYVIEKEPKAYSAYYIRSFMTKGKKGQLDKALEDADKAIALNPTFWPSYKNRADIFERMRLFDKALADYDKAIAIRPSDAEIYYNRGMLFEKIGQRDKAAVDYDKVISLNPQHHQAYYNLGLLSLKEGSRNEALSFFDRSIAANPRYDKAYVSRGAVYAFLRQADRALEDLNYAIFLNQKNAAAYNERGNIYVRSGRKEEKALALSDFRTACNLGNNDGCSSLLQLDGVVIDLRNAPFKGNNDARFALIEFSDYQ